MTSEPMTDGMPAALDGVRVLDLTHHVAGPYCTKLLADHGADVIKVERPGGGDMSRREGPFPGDRPDSEASGLFLHLNTNKRSLTLDLATSDGRAIARKLAVRADLVVESFRPGTLDRFGLGYDALRAADPAMVLVSVSNFGRTGPYRDMAMSNLTAYAMGGAMHSTGHREREPLTLGGHVTLHHAGATAAYAAMLALYRAEDDGEGDHVDISIYETAAGSRDRRTVQLTAYAYSGFTAQRRGPETRLGSGVRPASDGYVDFAGYGARLVSLLRMIGRDDLAADPRVRDPRIHSDPEFVEEVEGSYLAWSTSHTKAEALVAGQQHHIVGGAINTIADLFTDPHFVERAPWDVIDHPRTGPLRYAGRPFIMSETPRQPPRRAPLLGEHTVEILRDELGYSLDDLARLSSLGVI